GSSTTLHYHQNLVFVSSSISNTSNAPSPIVSATMTIPVGTVVTSTMLHIYFPYTATRSANANAGFFLKAGTTVLAAVTSTVGGSGGGFTDFYVMGITPTSQKGFATNRFLTTSTEDVATSA